MSNFAGELEGLAQSVEPAGVEVDPQILRISNIALISIDERYGEASARPLAHHNARHGLAHAGRGIELANLIYEEIPERYQEGIYDLSISGGTGHDWMQDFRVFGLNEHLSAAYLAFMIGETEGNALNTRRQISRSTDGVIVTTAQTTEDGNVVQPYLLKGEPDPHKFIAAFADVDAIAFGGIAEMLKVSATLPKEFSDKPQPSIFYNFLAREEPFIRKRLNPIRMTTVLKHFFSDNAEVVYEKMFVAFNQGIVAAYQFAQEVGRRTDIADDIGEALLNEEYQQVGELIDIPLEI